jgi:hypothetical protein
MVPTERVSLLLVLRKLCSIFLNVLFLTLLAQKILSVITYSREELLNIRATPTYQHYDQEYDFPKATPKAFKLFPEADPKQRSRRRGRGLHNASPGANYLPSGAPTAPNVTGRPKRSSRTTTT